MTDNLSIRAIEERLLTRWPETKLEPSLDRIVNVMRLLGDPQRRYRSIHITGTNGKTSTARMVEALLAASGERTGRLTSPHLTSVRERIGIAEEVIDVRAFRSAYSAVGKQAELVDATMRHPLSFFEMTVAMAYRAFADAAVDVAVVEVGMGGRWDATNVIDADVAVVLPVDLDHTDYLGPTTATIAQEKAGIIKPGSVAVSARQSADVAAVLQARARSVGASLVVQGNDFSLLRRTAVEGGQVISVQGLHGTYSNVFLALHGRHQADNAACAIAAAEAAAGRQLDLAAVRAGLGQVASPGRFDVRPGEPLVILDAAHNPHGARALVESLTELAPCRTFAVVAAMADKDVEGVLRELEPVVDVVVCTRNSSPRSIAPAKLAATARQVFGAQRIHVAFNVATAIEKARALAAPQPGRAPDALLLVTGSVVTVGDANRVLPPGPPMGQALPG
ncbi:bifunctional folylpolyglutamate synthase/dihydrofolate synthase [Kribbella sp. NPDC050470]|uniref:bifunctional folylpolyglutamate synthase/dihydrofolate synthase n=1 Tax=unclassified Kribbella TaxID=2644121 RepID=UPI003798353A